MDRPKTPAIFLRLPSVIARTGLSRSSIYQKIQQGEFPPPVKASQRISVWLESEIESWVAEVVSRSRA